MAAPGSLLGEKLLLGKITGQVLGELNLGGALGLVEGFSLGGVRHLVGLLEGVLILHIGGLSLPGVPLCKGLFLLVLVTWITLGGVGGLDSGDGAGDLRLPMIFLFGDDLSSLVAGLL